MVGLSSGVTYERPLEYGGHDGLWRASQADVDEVCEDPCGAGEPLGDGKATGEAFGGLPSRRADRQREASIPATQAIAPTGPVHLTAGR
jgi:hypothetical protein